MLNFQKILMPKVFGLDLSDNLVRVAQLPDKFAFGANIKEAVKKAGIKTKYVNISIPETECFVRLAPKDGDIKREVESNIPLGLQEIYYDYKEIQSSLFIAAAKRKIVDNYISQLKKNGFVVQAVEPESIATARALAKGLQNKNSLIIKASQQQAVFIIISAGIIKFTAVNALEQASNYLDFYQTRGEAISNISLCGDDNLQKASEFLKKLNLPINIAQNPRYTTAIGLALKND